MSVYTIKAHAYQIIALSSFVGSSPAAPLAVQELAGAFNAAMIPTDWPSPPGVAPLNQAQKDALFAAECGIGPQSAFDALTPGMDEGTRNVYRQFYGPSAQGWPEVQYWYSHR